METKWPCVSWVLLGSLVFVFSQVGTCFTGGTGRDTLEMSTAQPEIFAGVSVRSLGFAVVGLGFRCRGPLSMMHAALPLKDEELLPR